jgi:ABC-type sulfate/molybdate transport systems ATPase subunit
MKQRLGCTSIVVTHDMMSAFALADRIAMLANRRIVQVGTPEEMRRSTVPEVRAFLDARRAELEGGDAADSPQNWGIGGARAGLRLLSEENQQFIWQWIMFNQPDKALYVVILEWAGHTHAELDDEWFTQAPFTGPAGT